MFGVQPLAFVGCIPPLAFLQASHSTEIIALLYEAQEFESSHSSAPRHRRYIGRSVAIATELMAQGNLTDAAAKLKEAAVSVTVHL